MQNICNALEEYLIQGRQIKADYKFTCFCGVSVLHWVDTTWTEDVYK